jgi:LytS/YehU family sensor histidine kinase
MKANMIEELVGSTNVNLINYLERNQSGNILSVEVKAYNSDGFPSEESSKIEMTIDSRWHRILWANTLFFFAFVGLIYGYLRYRITQIRKEEAFKREKAEFQQKETEYKQLVAETESAMLRLQMNPHFIFNCMNSINSYILQKDVNTASGYLHHFARLMRMILKFSEKPFISVSDEIELLELYLQTEALRFNNKFNFSFELKNGLDPDEYVIPTMILQPLVENAIRHGISNKKEGKRHIKISFWKENESLLCSVEDNGVGRAASCQISKNTKMHESKALSITEHRLQLLEKNNCVSASFEIQDLIDESQKPIGTKVILRFPLL